MSRLTSNTFIPAINEGSPVAKGCAYLGGVTCVFYVTPLYQLRVRAFGVQKVYKLLDNVTWVAVLEDVDAQGRNVARVYYTTTDGGVWLASYYEFGSNSYNPFRLALKVGKTKARQLSITKHRLLYPAELNTPDRTAYFLMTDNGVTQVIHLASDPEFTQTYSSRICYNNELDPSFSVNTPSIGFHPEDPLRMQVAVQRIDKQTRKSEVGVYVVSFDDRDRH